MNEKLYNHTDQRARDAINMLQTFYNEQSWVRMEALLDDKKKRPFLFWFFLSGLLIFIFGWGIYKFSSTRVVHKVVQQPISEKNFIQKNKI